MCSFVVPDAKQFGFKKIQVDEHIGIIGQFPPLIEQVIEFPINGILDALGGILMFMVGYVRPL